MFNFSFNFHWLYVITKSLYLKVNYKVLFVFVLLSSSIQGIGEENKHNKNFMYKDILPGKKMQTVHFSKMGGGGVCKVDRWSLLFFVTIETFSYKYFTKSVVCYWVLININMSEYFLQVELNWV